MTTPHRRAFLEQTGATLAATAALSLVKPARAAAANDTIAMALIGCGGRGRSVARNLAALDGVTMTWVCDPDQRRAAEAVRELEDATGRRPRVTADLREVLDDDAVDAVQIATPDHWHAPAAILACQAGKHVYVEKPCSHNVREGRLLVEAAQRHGRVVQTGTQSRSNEHILRAMSLLAEGAIGRVLVAKAWNSQRRADIGHAVPSAEPDGFDYDLWLGPAPQVPFQSNRHHYTWHWWYDFGTGDMGNDGVHELDIARWGLGVEVHPQRVAAVGGKYYFDDDQQFPDTQYVVFEYAGDGSFGQRRQLIYEHRIWSPYVQEGHENGNAFYGTDGMLILGKHGGWKLFGPRNQLIESMSGTPGDPAHQADFIEAIRAGRPPRASAEVGHLSATLCHLGNIACRVGRSLTFDPQREVIVDDDEAAPLVGRTYRQGHWAVPTGV